jgi:NADH dehydrogenase
MAREMLHTDYRTIDTGAAQIFLVEMASRVLPAFTPRLSHRAARALEASGVTPLLGRRVVGIDEHSVEIDGGAGPGERLAARTVIWAAGVVGSELAQGLGEQSGAAVDRNRRVAVGPDLTLPGHPEVAVVGDMAAVHGADGAPVPLPGLAPVAMQQGRYAAQAVRTRRRGGQPPPFRYVDKGNLATIGRAKAVAEVRGLQLSGFPAWVTWLVVHIYYLVGVQNRLVVLVRWAASYLTRRAGAQLIAGTDPVRSSP